VDHKLPPPGTTMDTITGKFEAPGANSGFTPWVKNPKGLDLKPVR
jgi:hypothetical protein